MRFQLVPKSMTSDDLERPKCTLAAKTFYGAYQKNLIEGRHMLSAEKYRSMILVSRNIRYMQIFAGVPWSGVNGHQTTGGQRQHFSVGISTGTLEMKPALL